MSCHECGSWFPVTRKSKKYPALDLGTNLWVKGKHGNSLVTAVMFRMGKSAPRIAISFARDAETHFVTAVLMLPDPKPENHGNYRGNCSNYRVIGNKGVDDDDATGQWSQDWSW